MKTTSTADSATIRYGTGPTPVGRVLLALSDQGICGLHLVGAGGVSAGLRDVKARFPEARLVPDPAAVGPALTQLEELLAGRRTRLEMDLDLRGTPFQKRVWQALLRVPWGTTCSYTDLARQSGKPRAVRAVANACGRNPVAIVVPCHRIVRSDGSLGGYGGGLDVKRKLLRLEQEVQQG